MTMVDALGLVALWFVASVLVTIFVVATIEVGQRRKSDLGEGQ